MAHVLNFRHFGPPRVSHDIRQLRRSNMDMAMKLGQPVIWMHKFSNDDLDSSYALSLPGVSWDIDVEQCPACFNSYRGQVRSDCPACFGTSFTSVERATDEWIDEDGEIVTADPGTGEFAPVWRGFGPAVITWIIEPDAAVDVFKLSPEGAIVQTQNAQAFAPWYPPMSDNDLLVNVTLSDTLDEITDTHELYEAKMVNPISIRGWGKKARGDEFLVAQTFEMSKLPSGHPYAVIPFNLIPEPDSQSWEKLKQRAVELANVGMRSRYLWTDAGIGTSILRGRKKGLSDKSMFQLYQNWSPIAWLRQPGLHFEITQLNAMALGERMLDPEVDQIMVDAVEDAIVENHEGILQQMIQDLIDGDSSNFEIADWHA